MTEITRQQMVEAVNQQIDSFEEMEAVSEQDEISYYSAKVILWKAIRAALTEQQAQAFPERTNVVRLVYGLLWHERSSSSYSRLARKQLLSWLNDKDQQKIGIEEAKAAIEAARREGRY